MSKDYNTTVSVRIPVSMVTNLDEEVKQKKYLDRSDAIREKIKNSDQLDALMEIAKNPELQKEMNKKIQDMVSNSSVEQTLETMSIKEREAMIFYAKHLNEKALMQTKFR